MNNISIVGRLTKDPEVRTTNSGKTTCSFTLAVNRRGKRQEGSPTADFFRVTCWEQSARYAGDYLRKGKLASATGRMEERKWTAQDGQEVRIWELVADSVNGLERRDDDGDPANTGTGNRSTSSGTTATATEEYDPFADE